MPSVSLRHPARPTAGWFVSGALMAVVLTACGGGSGSGTTASPSPRASVAAPGASADATVEPNGSSGAAGADGLAALTPTGSIQAVLGEAPTPKCSTSVAFGGDSCVWTAADGSWLKVEHGVSGETATKDAFTQRMTKTLGVDQPVAGLGEAAFSTANSRGARIAVYLGAGDVLWVVINKPGDGATQTSQVKDIATTIIAGL